MAVTRSAPKARNVTRIGPYSSVTVRTMGPMRTAEIRGIQPQLRVGEPAETTFSCSWFESPALAPEFLRKPRVCIYAQTPAGCSKLVAIAASQASSRCPESRSDMSTPAAEPRVVRELWNSRQSNLLAEGGSETTERGCCRVAETSFYPADFCLFESR